MFEQSLLLDHAAAKKTGAMAASLTVQTLAVGVMIAIPLIFSDHLPPVPRFISLSLPSPPPPLPPAQEHPAVTSSASRAPSGPTKVFTAPKNIPDLSKIVDIGLVEAPPAFSPNDIGVPGGTGVPAIISQLVIQPIPQPKPRVADPPSAPPQPIRVVSDVQSAKLLKKVIPIYPSLARQARISGTVRLIGVIAKDGTIQQLQVTSGHPLLIQSALDAVRQWVYRPTLLNGQAVEVIAPIDVNFTLSQ